MVEIVILILISFLIFLYFNEKRVHLNKIPFSDNLNKKSICIIRKTKDDLLSTDRNLRFANDKAQDVTVKK